MFSKKISTVLLTGMLVFLAFSVQENLMCGHVSLWMGNAAEENLAEVTPPMKGMTVNAWSAEAYNSSDFDQSITNLASIKANWVTLTVFWFMNTSTSTEIQPRLDKYTASDSSLIHAIQKSHELNMKVALKPMVDVVDGSWRGLISPANWTLWFESYRSFINHFADLAEAENVEMFVVGTELRSAQQYESEWRQVISEVRTRFSQNITYAANWDSYKPNSVKFWDALDYVGVDAYFPLTNSFNPTLSQLISAWSYCTNSGYLSKNWTNDLYLVYTQTGKKMLFTEIGYCSQDGTNTRPWDWNISPTVDLQEQADCYQAALEAFKDKAWFEGWFWWNWETDPNAGKPGTPDEKHYTPQNKPAQNVLKYYYGAFPDIAVTNVVCSETVVEKGDLVTINVTLENQGVYTETFNVTAYANTTIIQKQEITLENGSSMTLSFFWNTSSFAEGNYSIKAYAEPIPFETDIADNTYIDGFVLVTILHDIALVSVVPSKTIVGQGHVMNINVTVENQGYSTETFDVTAYANTTIIATLTNIPLTSGNTTTIIFTWNTTSFTKGNYTIWAYAWPVLGETETANNNRTDGIVWIKWLYDVTGDGYCGIDDIVVVAEHFGTSDPLYDVTQDGYVGIDDIVAIAEHFGQTDI
jgi:hypothetical protein